MPLQKIPATIESVPAVTLSGAANLFLHDLTSWREQISRSIARNNLGMRSEAIATATNRTVGWLLMLCIAEDRGLITTGNLQKIGEAEDSFRRLADIFRNTTDPWKDETSDDHRHAAVKDAVVIEDAAIKKIVSRCCSPERPYDFAAVPTEVIAQVCGTYLARTIKRSAAHQAVVVDSHDTVLSDTMAAPTLGMIEYMVKSAMHDTVANRSPREVLPIRIIDPACGAGLVLICAYRHLVEVQGGRHPTFAEREEILRHSIHGVDINPHAVATTKMLLLFALCEREDATTLPEDFFTLAGLVFRELGHMIRCGNALINPDIVNDESWAFCPARERHAINLFSWNSNFPEIFSAGGFDAVIGNLPVGPLSAHEWIQQYFQRHYEVYHPAVDRFAYFVEKGLALLRKNGVLGAVISDRWLRAKSGTSLRHLVVSHQIEEIVMFGEAGENREFPAPCIIRLTNRPPSHALCVAQVEPSFAENLSEHLRSHRYPIEQGSLDDGGWTLRDTRARRLLDKVCQNGTPLRESVLEEHYPGITMGGDDAFVISELISKKLIKEDSKCKTLIRPLISGSGIERYEIQADPKFIIFIPQGWTNRHKAAVVHPWRWLKKRHPGVARHLKQSAEKAKTRTIQGDYWWETACDQDFWRKKRSRILFAKRFTRPAFVFDYGRAIADDTACAIASSGLYLLGVLNSRLISFVITHTVQIASAEQQDFGWDNLKDLPVYTPDFDNPADVARYKQMESLVSQMLELHRYLPRAKNDLEKRLVQQEIDALDVRIDALVYELYGLTADEIAVVEESMGK
jgi:hypothetical protein